MKYEIMSYFLFISSLHQRNVFIALRSSHGLLSPSLSLADLFPGFQSQNRMSDILAGGGHCKKHNHTCTRFPNIPISFCSQNIAFYYLEPPFSSFFVLLSPLRPI